MTRDEFESLTGFRPTWSMYRVIENTWIKSGLDVAEFCRRYSLNVDGIAEAIRHQADIMESQAEQENLEILLGIIQNLKEQLDTEQEWQESDVYGTCMTQEEYLEICTECNSISDETAVKILSITFGLIPEKIRIRHEVQEFECNKYGDCRAKRTFQRKPVYENIERNYIRFDCAGRQWELVNSDLLTYDEPEKNEKGEKDVMG